jgi:hypothetical protein
MHRLSPPCDWLSWAQFAEQWNVARRTRKALTALQQLPTTIFSTREDPWIRQCRSCVAANFVAVEPQRHPIFADEFPHPRR